MTVPSRPAASLDDFPVAVHLGPDDLVRALRAEVRAGLTRQPKELSPKWLYDERGSALFEEITRLPEYYPTRAERAILERHAGAIAARAGADTLVELGSGSSEKTRILLDAMRAGGRLRRFVLFDVAEPTLRAAGRAIAAEHPGLEIEGIVGDFERHLDRLPGGDPRLVAFLGGTIGNLHPPARQRFLAQLAAGMRPGDSLLLGTDLVKDRDRLLAAYDDAAGVTALFNRNVLAMLNRELNATFDLDRFRHVVRYDEDEEWVEMRLRSLADQTVRIDALDLRVEFAAGEEMRTEISAKFRPERVREELGAAGLDASHCWTDPAGDFALWLAIR